MASMLFGEDTAQHDDLLHECEVHASSLDRTKQIVTGRWGTGKTAHLLLQNADLGRALLEVDHDLERVWLIDEKAIDSTYLLGEFHKSQNHQHFRRNLELMWKAEIVRRVTIILASLAQQYGSVSGPHWKFVHRMAKAQRVATSILAQIPHALKVLAGLDAGRVESVEALQGKFEEVFTDAAYRSIQHCLRDIKGLPRQPVVAIEPIDTPTSALEDDVHLAQDLVTALLNAFVADFLPSSRQNLYVILSLPWHRFVSDAIDFPQRLPSYTSVLHWGPEELRNFINLRIAWEFRRVGRHFVASGTRDESSALFEDTVRNIHCTPAFDEDSFSYVLRHTQHRPRQLQQIARLAVDHCASQLGRHKDDILSGRGGLRIHGTHIVQSAGSAAKVLTDNVITEAGRRFPGFRTLVDNLKGIRVPFTVDDVTKRLSNVTNSDVPTVIDMLYQAGILGVQIAGRNRKALRAVLPAEAKKVDRNSRNQVFERYYFFEYSVWSDGSKGFELCQRYAQQDDIEVRLVLNPAAYEYLHPAHVTHEYPIGV